MNDHSKPLPKKGIHQIVITFPVGIEPWPYQAELSRIAKKICDDHCPDGMVMWPCGAGYRMTYMPMTLEEEESRAPEYDEDTFDIECTMREAYPGEKQ